MQSTHSPENLRKVLEGSESFEDVVDRLNQFDDSYYQIEFNAVTVAYGGEVLDATLEESFHEVNSLMALDPIPGVDLNLALERLNEVAKEWCDGHLCKDSSARFLRVVSLAGPRGTWPLFEIGVDGLGDLAKFVAKYDFACRDPFTSLEGFMNEFVPTLLSYQ